MEFTLQRINDNNDSTIGYLKGHGYFAFTLEDQHQDKKVPGETRIPADRYELVIYAVETPLTMKHRKAYGDWFKFHIMIKGIPNFKYVYFHAGNDDDHTEGCIMPADQIRNNDIWFTKQSSHSIQAVKRLYELVYPKLENKERVFIDIRD